MIEPFIEVPILDNVDDIEEFLEDYGYTTEDLYVTIKEDEEERQFSGFAAELYLFTDDEMIAVTTTWSDKTELLDFLKEAIGDELIVTH